MNNRKRKTNNSQNNNVSKKSRIQANDSDVEEEEIQSESRSEATISQPNQHELRSGKVLAVKLRNFMCHRNLSVHFNRQTNLLIGQNGSGKSAVLTALIIGLGAKANATNRSQNIRQLIRTGEQSATIEVHLSNDGTDAYEYSKYGEKVIVMRHITSSGASSYKLKSASGIIVSTSRSDLLKLILYMNIQVDNPVCVLTQDASRGFLRDSDPKKRYELFMRATQMDIIIEKLNSCSEQIQKARDQLTIQAKLSEKLKKSQDEAEHKLKQFRSTEPLKEELKRYKCEQQWIGVINQENFMQEIKSTLDSVQIQKDNLIHEIRNSTTNDHELQVLCTELNADINLLTQSCATEQKKIENLRNNFKAKNEKLLEHSRESNKMEAKIKRIQCDIEKLRGHISEQLNSNKSATAEIKENNEQKITEYKNRQKEIEVLTIGSKRDMEMISNTKNHLEEKLNGLKNQMQHIDEEIKRINIQLKQNHSSSKGNLSIYGQFMPQLVSDIEKYYKSGKFSKMPLGPVGNYVEVINPKYRKFVEEALSSVLNSFCIDNPKDLLVFRNLIKSKYSNIRPISTITSKFMDREYDVKGKCVQSDNRSVSLMDTITTDNPNIMNCLIDQCHIDSILFVEDPKYATHITSRRENVPKNLSKVVLLEPYSEFYPAPNFRSYSKQQIVVKYLRVSSAHREKYFQAQLEKATADKNEITNEMMQLQIKLKDNNQMLNERRANLKRLEPEMYSLRVNINELEAFEYPQEVEVSLMEVEVNEQTKILDETNMKYKIVEEQKHQIKAEITSLEQEIKDLRDVIQNMEAKIKQETKKKEDATEKLNKIISQAKYSERKVEKLNEALNRITKEYNESIEKCNRLTLAAERSGARLEPTHTNEQLLAYIKGNEKKINLVTSSKETLESVLFAYNKAQSDYIENGELVSTLRSAVKTLITSTRLRFRNIKYLKEYMISRASYHFTKVMELRGYEGELIVNSDERTLEIKVIPRDKDGTNVVSKAKNLSGGERSYLTVAFLMSLWTCVDHPFYFLDEYDVFTDQVNRMYMTKLLLHEADQKPHNQYTFLTPQDTSELTASSTLSILRLENPDR